MVDLYDIRSLFTPDQLEQLERIGKSWPVDIHFPVTVEEFLEIVKPGYRETNHFLKTCEGVDHTKSVLQHAAYVVAALASYNSLPIKLRR